MGAEFDPYLKWLGIKSKDQPPHHYRLLAIELFEDDADVIENASDQRMAHVRNFQSGKHADLSQKILNELSAAKVTLLDPRKKQAYDAELHEQLASQENRQQATGQRDAEVEESSPRLREPTPALPASQPARPAESMPGSASISRAVEMLEQFDVAPTPQAAQPVPLAPVGLPVVKRRRPAWLYAVLLGGTLGLVVLLAITVAMISRSNRSPVANADTSIRPAVEADQSVPSPSPAPSSAADESAHRSAGTATDREKTPDRAAPPRNPRASVERRESAAENPPSRTPPPGRAPSIASSSEPARGLPLPPPLTAEDAVHLDFNRQLIQWMIDRGMYVTGHARIERRLRHFNPSRSLPAEPFKVSRLRFQGTQSFPAGLMVSVAGLKYLQVLYLMDVTLSAADTQALGAGCPDLRVVSLSRSRFDPLSIKHIAGLPNVRFLMIHSCELDDRVFAELRGTRLESLRLDDCQVTGDGLQLLSGSGLRSLHFSQCPISAEGLRQIAQLENLTDLSLEEMQLSDAMLRLLGDLPQLESLDVSETALTSASAEYLASLNSLTKLTLRKTRLGAGAFEQLADLSQLERLDVSYTGFDDAAFQAVASFPSLKQLTAMETELRQLGDLDKSQLQTLEHLNLNDTPITDQAIAKLTNLEQLKWLHLSDAVNLTDACVDDLAKLQNLSYLYIAGSNLSPDAIEALKRALPECRIQD